MACIFLFTTSDSAKTFAFLAGDAADFGVFLTGDGFGPLFGDDRGESDVRMSSS